MRSHRKLWCSLLLACTYAHAKESLTLDQAISEALSKNAALLAERANIAVADAQIITARLRPNPVFSASANHLDALGTGFNDANGGGPSEITLHTDFTLERGGKRRARTAVAQAARSVVELQFRDAARGLVLDVQNAFVDVLLAKATRSLAEQNLEALNRIVEINTVRLKAGDIAEVELIRSRLAALQFENSVNQSALRVRTALGHLQTVMGRRAPIAGFDVSGEFRTDTGFPALDELQRTAGEQRPDLLAAQRDIVRADAELRSQQAQAKQDLTLGAEYTRQQINAKANALGVSMEFPLPLFNRNQGEIARATAEQHQAQLRFQSAQSTAAGEVHEAYEQYTSARSLLDNIERRMLKQAREVRDITEFSYRHGDATLLELLDAQRAFNDTMQSFNEARADLARSAYLLDSAIGRSVLP